MHWDKCGSKKPLSGSDKNPMNLITQFHFIRPEWLLLMPISAGVIWLLWRRINRNSQWEGQCDPFLLRVLLVGAGSGKQWIPIVGLGTIWLLALVALAGPAWEQRPQPVFSKLHSRVLILDLSQSMDSGDLSPSRLERARFKLNDLISGAGSRQQSLIVFAGDAFVVSPFTDDTRTLINLIPSLTTQTVPVQGSRSDRALKIARELIENAAVSNAEIIMLTDGVDAQSQDTAIALAAEGHRLHVLAVGTSEGAPIPTSGGGLLKDSAGNIVIPGVDHVAMKTLASAGGGRYWSMRADDSDIDALNKIVDPEIRGNFSQGERTDFEADTWIDNGIWLLIPIALLSVLSFRRGWILSVMLLLNLPNQASHALGWNDLWLRADQQASRALAEGEPARVPERSGAAWRGAAAFRQAQHDAAAQLFEQLDTSTAHYNRGNSLAKAGDLQAALDAYQKALAMQPELEDARYNHDLVERLLNQQQQQQRNQQSTDQNQNQDKSEQQQQEREQGGGAASSNADDAESESAARPENQQAMGNQLNDDPSRSNPDERAQDNQQDQQAGSGQNSESGSNQTTAQREMNQIDEGQQELEQWLKQVPDDPGGLLRRKFRYQYSLRPQQAPEVQQW